MAAVALALIQTDAAAIAARVGERPGTAAAQQAVANSKLAELLDRAVDLDDRPDTDALVEQVMDRCRDAALALEGRLSLVQINDHLGLLLDAFEMVEDGDAQAAIQELILGYVGRQADKVDSIAGYIAHCDERAEGAKAEAERHARRRKMYERRAEALRDWVKTAMFAGRVTKLSGETAEFTLRACPASVAIHDEAGIPAEFWREKVEHNVDKTALKAALKALPNDEERYRAVPGAVLITDKKALVMR